MQLTDFKIMDRDEVIDEKSLYHPFPGFRPGVDDYFHSGGILKPTKEMVGLTVYSYCLLFSVRHTFLKLMKGSDRGLPCK